MAQTESVELGFDVENLPAQPAQAPQKRGVGRPRKAREPVTPPQISPTDDFFLMLKGFEPDLWKERLFMYLYRTMPLIDRKQTPGQDNNLEKLAEPVDPDDIMKRHGSGGYKLMLIEFDPTQPRNLQYRKKRECFFRIMNPNFPPKIPLGEWIDDPRNKDWAWAKARLEADEKANAAATNPAVNSNDAAALFKLGVQAVKDLAPESSSDDQMSIAKFAIEQMEKNSDRAAKANDPAAMITLVTTIVGLMRPQAAPQSGTDPMTAFLLQSLEATRKEAAEERKFNRELMLAQQQQNNNGGLKAKLEELTLMKQLGAMFRAAPAAPEPGWIEKLGTQAIEILPGIVDAVTRPRTAPPPPRQANRQPRPEIIDGTATPAAAGTEAQPDAREEHEEMIQLINRQYGGMFDTIAPFMVDQFVRGMSGMDFRDWLCEEYGAATWRGLKSMSVETLIAVLELRKTQAPEHVQVLLANLQPVEKVRAFILEFQSDEESPNAGDDDDDDKPTPPADLTPVSPAPTANRRTF